MQIPILVINCILVCKLYTRYAINLKLILPYALQSFKVLLQVKPRPEKAKRFLVHKLHICHVTNTKICWYLTNAVSLLCAKFRGVGSYRTCLIAIFQFYDLILVWSVK